MAFPRGPEKFSIPSPSPSLPRSLVEAPTSAKYTVTVSSSGSAPAMVMGILSPRSSVRTMTNWPGAALRDTAGALTLNILMLGGTSLFSVTWYTLAHLRVLRLQAGEGRGRPVYSAEPLHPACEVPHVLGEVSRHPGAAEEHVQPLAAYAQDLQGLPGCLDPPLRQDVAVHV